MPHTLWALDKLGGQAIVRHEGTWYRVAMDNGWQEIPLTDELDAARCTLFATYTYSGQEFDTLGELLAAVRTRCFEQLDIPQVTLHEVMHLCPPVVLRLAQGPRRDPEERIAVAFETRKFGDEFWNSVLSIARNYVERQFPSQDADEIASLAVLRLLTLVPQLEPDPRGVRFRALIQRVCRFSGVDTLRRRASRGRFTREERRDIERLEEIPSEVPTPEEEAMFAEQRELLFEAISQLSPLEQGVIHAHMAGYTSMEISRSMGVRHGNVQKVRQRAVGKLRRLIEESEQ